ncbi:glycosyltransferase family 4 protein [Neobacillus niacini]|uniref:glycosyltransferase family 4 protein n=1 Tax=Neobacillus niacini TaxID=86668 RepID=UPI002FFF738A
MRIFFVGDFTSETGPSIANNMLRKGLEGKDILYSNAKTKPMRIIELILNALRSDCVCFCSYSQLNFIGMKIAKVLQKKTFYIMHGYRTYEYKINKEFCDNDELKKINDTEKNLFKSVDKVFCVSKKFMEYMKKVEPAFEEKFDYNYNCIDFDKMQKEAKGIIKRKKDNQIVSIGGGMRQKNILTICKAIEKLNQKNGIKLRLIVIGLPYTDKESICSYDFVTYYDRLPHEKVLEILSESSLYIQNSTFETFGLAVIEALTVECNLLLSKNIGAIDLITTIKDNDVIYDIYDECEIARKIDGVLKESNAINLRVGLSIDEASYKTSATKLYNKINKFMEEG